MLDKIQSYFGFATMPFGRNLAPGMLHHHHAHNEAAARIVTGIQARGITVITGEVGVGKTAAARAALAQIGTASHHLIYIPDPTVGPRGVFQHIVSALGGKPLHETGMLVPQCRDLLATESAERGRVPIVMIDECHHLRHTGLEAVRMMTNADLDTTSPFATVLLGQPTLAQQMRLGHLAALDQRITLRHHMTGMQPADTVDYVTHHLRLAGRTDALFTTDALNLIHSTSRGKPRSVNNLCISGLIAAFASNKNLVDETSARTAVTETTRDLHPTPTP